MAFVGPNEEGSGGFEIGVQTTRKKYDGKANYASRHIDDFDGAIGALRYLIFGGDVGAGHYDANGNLKGPAWHYGTAPTEVGLSGIKLFGAAKTELTVYRVFGGDARAQGFSWTTVNPTSVKNFRNLAGLPSGGASGSMNTADFMIKGNVNINSIIKSRSALPLDGNVGGLRELIINPKNVRLTDFRVLKP